MSAMYSTIAFFASILSIPAGGVKAVDHSIRAGSTADQTFGIMNALGRRCFLAKLPSSPLTKLDLVQGVNSDETHEPERASKSHRSFQGKQYVKGTLDRPGCTSNMTETYFRIQMHLYQSP